MEIKCSDARWRKVEWVEEGGIWISLWDVGEVRVANVGSDPDGVNLRFISYEKEIRTPHIKTYKAQVCEKPTKGWGYHIWGNNTLRGRTSSTAGTEDTPLAFIERFFLPVFWTLVDTAFFGFRT